ncbi:MAG: hypothetical protein EA349_12410 [Halomonadaceae bacterium]|nr:MAG: hypothetical protein EA349_12410 [Halomonadaceae bacterium]
MKMNKSRLTLLAGGLISVVAIVVMVFLGAGQAPEKPPSLAPLDVRGHPEHAVASDQSIPRNRQSADSESAAHELPRLPLEDTIKGIDVDGRIHLDRNGNLVYDRDLRRLLDFFIGLTQSREDEPALKQRISAYMAEQGVPPRVQDDVLAILDDYLDYREASEVFAAQGGEELEQAFERLYSLRRNHLGQDVADGFFADEEARVQMALDRQRILGDDSLSDEQRQQALLQLEQQLPEPTRQMREQARTIEEVGRAVAQLREQGASDEEVRALRAQRLGPEAAERFSRVDQQRDQWQQRLSAYQQERARIESTEGLSPQDRAEAISKLREQHFDSEHELRRARALERIANQAGNSP